MQTIFNTLEFIYCALPLNFNARPMLLRKAFVSDSFDLI